MTGATATAAPTEQAPTPPFFWRVALFFAGWTALHLAPVAALVHGVVPGGWWAFAALYVLLLLAVWRLLASFREDAHPGKLHRLFVMRPFWYVQLGLPFVSVAGALAWLAGLAFGRALLWGRIAVAASAGLLVLAYVAGYLGSKRLVVRRLELSYPDLPAAFDGVTFAQLSDLHVGPQTSDRYLRRVVRAVEDAKPDAIVHTGDQVDDYHEDTPRFTSFFGPLRAPLGSFAIAGNHDVYAGWPQVRAGLEAAGMRVLVNESIPLRRGEDTLWLAGTGDPAALRSMGAPQPDVAPDIERTLAGVPAGAFTVVLAHNPALFPSLARRGVALTLSGHTHHGQLSIPALRWSLASPFLKYAMGEYVEGRSRLYINPGTNYWALPFRLGAWPEVTLVTLRRA